MSIWHVSIGPCIVYLKGHKVQVIKQVQLQASTRFFVGQSKHQHPMVSIYGQFSTPVHQVDGHAADPIWQATYSQSTTLYMPPLFNHTLYM